MGSRGKSASILDALRFTMERVTAPSYLLAAERTVLYANSHALGDSKAIDDVRLRELEELTQPLAAPPGVNVCQIVEGDFRAHRVIDLTRSIELDQVTRAHAKQVGLTPAETEVCVRWVRKLSVRQVAGELGCSMNTVKTHLKEIRHKTGTSRQIDLIELMMKLARR